LVVFFNFRKFPTRKSEIEYLKSIVFFLLLITRITE